MFSWHEAVQYARRIQTSGPFSGRQWTFFICMIELQESFKRQDIQFSSLIVYHCQMTCDIAWCLFHTPAWAFSSHCSFHYFPSPLRLMRTLPCQSARSICGGLFLLVRGAGPSAPQLDKKIKVQNRLAGILVNSRRRTSVIPRSWRCVTIGAARFGLSMTVRCLLRKCCQSKHLVDYAPFLAIKWFRSLKRGPIVSFSNYEEVHEVIMETTSVKRVCVAAVCVCVDMYC